MWRDIVVWGLIGMAGCSRAADSPDYADKREMMIERDIVGRGIRDERVIAAMRKVPRHEFIAPNLREQAYGDYPLPIDSGQTISQPYIVALMTELARLGPDNRVLEIGTGSGYQAAVLAEIAADVFTIEIIPHLARQSAGRLKELGYDRVQVREGDGYRGWKEEAPFDAILVTAAPKQVPPPLVEQLKPGGRLVIPVGSVHAVQQLMVITRNKDGSTREESIIPVRFVPLTGEAESKADR